MDAPSRFLISSVGSSMCEFFLIETNIFAAHKENPLWATHSFSWLHLSQSEQLNYFFQRTLKQSDWESNLTRLPIPRFWMRITEVFPLQIGEIHFLVLCKWRKSEIRFEGKKQGVSNSLETPCFCNYFVRPEGFEPPTF
jgi:hypothetical protein